MEDHVNNTNNTKNTSITMVNLRSLIVVLSMGLCLSAVQEMQASRWDDFKNMLSWNTPGAKVAMGVSDATSGIKNGTSKIVDGITDALYNTLAKGASMTGISYAWKNYRKATALSLASVAVIGGWALYRTA
jgi:hypothetical protein